MQIITEMELKTTNMNNGMINDQFSAVLFSYRSSRRSALTMQ